MMAGILLQVVLTVAGGNEPRLLITLPHATHPAVEVIFPERVNVHKNHGKKTKSIYVSTQPSARLVWHHDGKTHQYERDLGGVHLLARATQQADGVLLHYELTNNSETDYDMIYAVTDPHLEEPFRDVRLQRTYVHHPDGFELLASETPERLTMPLEQWLPARYSVAYRWPHPSPLVQRREGIMHYNKSRSADEPLMATLSSDRQWVVATFTRDTGYMYTDPEFSSHHVDTQVMLPPHETRALEVKLLVMRGSLDDVQRKFLQQRNGLR